ncbi:hypothetical protein [Aeromicrobium phoceense]|uniref:Uncharacterized protein n=1 Tax=Aeromicrobium phoceense TaxID=2754045 RepID=A0A838XFB2_9ACTN|nr:hypothetical protein [Aeromicrobium phoceense]MBA4608527.1 hypothetical protein [Aeromicrobium phoceense]
MTVVVAISQLALLAALAWLWSTGVTDATATNVDWGFVLLATGTPVALVLSSWVGRRRQERTCPREPEATRVIALVTQRVTLGLTGLTLIVAPFVIFGALVFGPMG